MIPSNLIQEPVILCNLNPRELVSSFIDALDNLATQSKAQLKMNFLQIVTTKESNLARILETLDQRRTHCIGLKAEDFNSENS